MSSNLTEAGEITRRFDLAEHAAHRAHHPAATRTGARRRDQLAASLRRVADRLEQ